MLHPPPSKRRSEGAAGAAADRAALKPLVLVVEDEPALVTLLRYNFEAAGYEVATALDGDEALTAIAERRPDLVVLDWMLPSTSGLEVCRQIRRKAETRDVPVIMLTARGEEADRVRGLDSGADDYVTKPFHMEEVLARLRALIRRSGGHAAPELSCGPVVLDTNSSKVTVNGVPVKLTAQELRLLAYLMHHQGKVVSRTELTEHIYDHDFDLDSNTIEVFIGRLRKKLGVPIIHTKRGLGYQLAPPGEGDSV